MLRVDASSPKRLGNLGRNDLTEALGMIAFLSVPATISGALLAAKVAKASMGQVFLAGVFGLFVGVVPFLAIWYVGRAVLPTIVRWLHAPTEVPWKLAMPVICFVMVVLAICSAVFGEVVTHSLMQNVLR